MSDTFDEQLRRAFDSLAERMRSTVADHVSVTVEQLTAASAAERSAAIEVAAREAATAAEQAVQQRLEQEFAQREAAIREAAYTEAFEAGQQQARAEALAIEAAREVSAQAEAEEAARLVAQQQDEIAAIRAEATARIDAALTAARVDAAAVAAQHEETLAALRAELENAQVSAVEVAARHADELARALTASDAAAADHAAALAVAHAAAARATEAAEDAARAAESRIERSGVERLLAAVRALDGATSLSQTLDALSAAAKAEAERSAVFLVRGEALRAWSHAGFEAAPHAGAFELPLADAGAAAHAVRAGTVQRVSGGADGRPAFAGDDRGGAFVSVPLTMNGQVIAVLCGEQPDATDAGEWLATHYEVLARHAARVLESLTALRLAQLGAHPAQAGAVSPPQ